MKCIRDNGLIIFLVVVICVALLCSWVFVKHIEGSFGSFFPTELKREEWGVLGDLFGGVLNPVFSFLGLLMLLVTLFQNQRELSLSRREFENSSKALKSQAATLENQRFEGTFFSLLAQHNIALTTITSDYIAYDSEGNQRKTPSIATRLKVQIVGGGTSYPLVEHFLGLEESREKFLKANSSLNQYFRILYQVLKFIASRCPNSSVLDSYSVEKLKSTSCSDDEKMYSNMVRALLSSDVFYLLAINSFSGDENDSFFKYRLLIERYAFLEHMPIVKSEMMNTGLLKEIATSYDIKAFGDNSYFNREVA
jgi:hypothetical protein